MNSTTSFTALKTAVLKLHAFYFMWDRFRDDWDTSHTSKQSSVYNGESLYAPLFSKTKLSLLIRQSRVATR